MATVIRAGEMPRIRSRPTAIDLTDHLDEARRLVDDARSEAARILAEAHSEVERAHRETRESGYEEGLVAGDRDGREAGFAAAHKEASAAFEREHADLVADLHRIVEELDGMKEDLQLAARSGLLRFAVDLARGLTFAIGSLHTESVSANLQRAIELLGSRFDVTVHAHPRDVAALRTFAAGVDESLERSHAMRLIEDASIAPGGCVVARGAAEIDATLETQVQELVALLLGTSETGTVNAPPETGVGTGT